MKFLDYHAFSELSRQLTFESPECKVFTRLEAYSCKAVKRERQLFKSLESQYLQSASLSPPNHLDEVLASPFGRLDQSAARKTLFLLIATLNAAFPDHDFSEVNPADFRREPNSASVLASLGTTLLSLRSNSNAPRSFSSYPSSYDGNGNDQGNDRGRNNRGINHPQLSSILDDIMDIADCEVYTFHPDADSDPHACAEPDEEGQLLDDERYADDEGNVTDEEIIDNAGGDNNGASNYSDRRSLYDGDSANGDDDAPMFDEDLLGSGFTPVHSRVSSNVTTPRTPSIAMRARAGDYFQSKLVKSAQKDLHAQMSSSMPADFSQRMHRGLAQDDEDMEDAYLDQSDEDDEAGLNGLLWATYAFFYNRKLKRVLFVSVWSRRNTAHMPVSYTFSPPSYPVSRSLQSNSFVSEKQVPPMSLDGAVAATLRQNGNAGADGQTPSPAKRAIAKSTGASRRGRGAVCGAGVSPRRRRSMSGSPAPSALSPFPHDAAHAPLHLPSSSGSSEARDGARTPTAATTAEPIAVRSTRASAAKAVPRGASALSSMALSPSSSSSSPASGSMSTSTRSAISGGSSLFSTSAKRAGEAFDAHNERSAMVGSAPKQRRM